MIGNSPLKIYFLGSGAIAVPALTALARDPRVVLTGVGTQPDRPAGRKLAPAPTPVGAAGDAMGIPVTRFQSVNTENLAATLQNQAVDFLVVASFGQLLKTPILEAPRCGCINIHASLLPKYRGASPIAAAIAEREPETGVSFMAMDAGLDTGAVFTQLHRPLDGSENATDLEVELGELAAGKLVDVLLAIAAGTLAAVPQGPARATMTHKLHKSDGFLDWRQPAAVLEAKVRAYRDRPGVFLLCPRKDQVIRIGVRKAKAHPELAGKPGEVLQADRRGWIVAGAEGALELLEVVPPGKKAMGGVDFLNGCRTLTAGTLLPLTEKE